MIPKTCALCDGPHPYWQHVTRRATPAADSKQLTGVAPPIDGDERQGRGRVPWFKVDDGFHSHPKVLRLSLAAIGLWTLAGSWSSDQLTDGFVPDAVIARLHPDGPSVARELRDAGLWHRKRRGYQFHEWKERNPLKEKVEKERAANRERQERWRERRGSGVSNGVTNDVTNSAPTRPDQQQNAKRSVVEGRGAEKAQRAPQPPPFTEAVERALNPDGGNRGRPRTEHP